MNPPGSNPTNPNRSYLENNIISPDSSMVTYGSYLKVQDLLSLQTRLSQPPEHDEMLFIIIHQSYELWFKQILHEMDLADFDLCQDNPFGALKTLKRITTIMRTLTDQVSILETMTPNDFNRFRDRLNPASGFQSWQFRLVEYRMGLKDDAFLKFFRTQPHAVQAMESAKSKPSFYDQVLRFLSRKGFEVPNDVLNRNVEEFYESNEGV
ncbi:MAG: tryptophan 2,3-dioxygenase family protein, partial [Proteobacteria bacterium]|nr:tryptophan 2,3-dioxygenase family protein [Pseudomonadota bacterium]